MQLVKKSWSKTQTSLSVPAVVLYHVGQLDDVLPLLVLLTQLKGLLLQRRVQKNVGEIRSQNRTITQWVGLNNIITAAKSNPY